MLEAWLLFPQMLCVGVSVEGGEVSDAGLKGSYHAKPLRNSWIRARTTRKTTQVVVWYSTCYRACQTAVRPPLMFSNSQY
jgi:hypothetical protein